MGQELSDRKCSEMVMLLEPAVFPGPGGLEFEEELKGGLFDGVLFAGVGLEVPLALFAGVELDGVLGVLPEAEAMDECKKKRSGA